MTSGCTQKKLSEVEEEEVYVVLAGSGRMKLDEGILEVDGELLWDWWTD